MDQGTPGEDQWYPRYPRRDTVGTHLLRWHRTESDGEGLSLAYALNKRTGISQVSQKMEGSDKLFTLNDGFLEHNGFRNLLYE